MPTPQPFGLLAQLCRAVAAAAPDRALDAALVQLAELGIVPAGSREERPWLELERGGKNLSLVLRGPLPAEELREPIADLLSLVLSRESEHEQACRVRERMEMLSAASFEGILIHIDNVLIDANQRLAEMLGYEHAEMIGKKMLPLCVAPEDQERVLERVKNRIEGEYVITGVRKDGSRFRAELHGKQGRLGTRPVRVAAVRDVTERERTNTLLRESETRLRDLLEAAFDATVLSRDGVIVDVGGRFNEIFGYAREQTIGQPLANFVAPAARPIVAQMIAEQRAGAYEAAALSVTGEIIPVEIVGVMSTFDGEPVRVAALRDLREQRRREDERRKLEQQVERSQRLESLGVLAGGIAHDFNNLLVGVLGNAELLLERLRDPLDRQAAQGIKSASERAASLTAQMLAYAGQRDLGRREPTDLSLLFRELGALLAATLSKKAELRLSIESGSVVLGDRATLTQVLMNLLTNASDALGDATGVIEVRTRRVTEPDSSFRHALGNVVHPGDWVLITVRDTGEGMDEATVARIFEPFFSTKAKGHGLGLAACLGIVSAHGGAIRVETKPGEGSTFSLLLPASEASSTTARERLTRSAEQPCRVLVVDDEPFVRTHLRRALMRHGYSVSEASDGASGLTLLQSAEVDVLVLDMTMPDMDGAEVVRRIRARGSTVPIVLASGYLEPTVERGLDRSLVQGFLLKPFGIADLIDAIERARRAR
ncbi:MAG TPA: PAS domain S-box protein [Polyangiaceae bacterium]|nr:PAS domain S-box protein [Polyangiaceae bacterium]